MFIPSEENLSGKKRWIGYATNVRGKLIVNSGAKTAILEKCTSLLPIGIIKVINEFNQGEVVSICDENEIEFARGMVNYNSEECKKIIGAHSDNILNILGYKNIRLYVDEFLYSTAFCNNFENYTFNYIELSTTV